MITFKLSDLKLTPDQLEENRAASIEMLQRFKDADEALTKLCTELGIPKPEIMC